MDNFPQVIFAAPGQLMIRDININNGEVVNEIFDSEFDETIHSKLYFSSSIATFNVLTNTDSEIFEFEYIGNRGRMEVKKLDTLGVSIFSDTLKILDSDFSGPGVNSSSAPIFYKDHWYLCQALRHRDNSDIFNKSNLVILDSSFNIVKDIDLKEWFLKPEIVAIRHILNDQILITNQFTDPDGNRAISMLILDVNGDDIAFYESLKYGVNNYTVGGFQFLSDNTVVAIVDRKAAGQHVLDVLQTDKDNNVVLKKTLTATDDTLRINIRDLTVTEDNDLILSTYVSLRSSSLTTGNWSYTTYFNAGSLDIVTSIAEPSNPNSLIGYKVYPNPFSSNIYLTSEDFSLNAVLIHDSTGKIFHKKQLDHEPRNIDTHQINTASWPKGAYFVVFENGSFRKTIPIIKN